MLTIKDKGALVCAIVAVVLALATWMRGDASRSQQIADLGDRVAHIEQQLATMQQELDTYLLRHDGH